METRKVVSTSKHTARVDDFVLRETSITRLIFRPCLVENKSNIDASVNGEFLFQRKGTGETWEDFESTPLSTIKKGEEVKLKIKSSELLSLHQELTNLYDLFETSGIQRGENQFIKAKGSLNAIAELSDNQISELIQGEEALGIEAIARLIKWASSAKNFSLIFEKLEILDPESLSNLNTAIGISSLKGALTEWKRNRHESAEKVWQDLLAKHTFVLEQLFHYPIFIIDESAYVGGKNIYNKEASLVDFLAQNPVSESIVLIEIKTPVTKLLGSLYRNGVYNISKELSGAVMQSLNYRDTLLAERDRLVGKQQNMFAFNPACVVIIGHAKEELDNEEKKKTFELFRRELKDVVVITYDELYYRTNAILNTFEGTHTK